jgi:hypothetical protein
MPANTGLDGTPSMDPKKPCGKLITSRYKWALVAWTSGVALAGFLWQQIGPCATFAAGAMFTALSLLSS